MANKLVEAGEKGVADIGIEVLAASGAMILRASANGIAGLYTRAEISASNNVGQRHQARGNRYGVAGQGVGVAAAGPTSRDASGLFPWPG